MLGFPPLALAFTAVIVAFPLVRYAFFVASNLRAGALRNIDVLSGGLPLALLKGMGTAVVSDCMALASFPLARFLGDKRDAGVLPVVMVHGLYHNRAAWLLMSRRLKRAGLTDLHAVQYNSFTRDFDAAVAGLERTLDRLLGPRPGARVILVGHSLGGLVCRAVAGDPRYAGRVAALVALGSPHGGAELARLGVNAMARGLIPGRNIPVAVAALPDPDCPKLALYSPVDDYVFPIACLRTGRPGWDERVVSPMGHVFMLYSAEVASAVAGFLRAIPAGGGGGQ
jgi:triacylglycerol esterase/lipase EstA (alpha/beta hydrolase family)